MGPSQYRALETQGWAGFCCGQALTQSAARETITGLQSFFQGESGREKADGERHHITEECKQKERMERKEE